MWAYRSSPCKLWKSFSRKRFGFLLGRSRGFGRAFDQRIVPQKLLQTAQMKTPMPRSVRPAAQTGEIMPEKRKSNRFKAKIEPI
jgi:hypothetical protein